ncbi:NDP-hexose 2,3-dehydratase family protein [Jatrophihabitans sp.]|uniref:NDP-hexose 2,3-dehydratase family protein n=1 Tax=Jatrophihabitans sp. TaxID=1932789 RepID=UPI002CC79E6A|nr:NDP-hexose 2,3-dehydratase family protein [Jatrophihabitans sp.]
MSGGSAGPTVVLAGADEVAHEARDVLDWLDTQRAHLRFQVERVALADIDGWQFDERSGNLARPDGAFFSIEGIAVIRHDSSPNQWTQPIINQPEIGLLGLLVRRNGGVVEGLFQAKAEPGQANLVQLAPTVQATRSNFMRAHGGSATRYLSNFWPPVAGVQVDVLQSEQGSRFLRKHNRNMVVEVAGDVEAEDGYRWISLGAVWALLQQDDVVNMDARSVLSCLPVTLPHAADRGVSGTADGLGRVSGPTARSLVDPYASVHSSGEILSWLAHERQRHCLQARLCPMRDIEGWQVGTDAIEHTSGRYFRVIGTRVSISGREVAAWSQPMIEAASSGLIAFLVKEINGTLHVLVEARCEAGLAFGVEIGPTVQCRPAASVGRHADAERFLHRAIDAGEDQVLYDAVLSEEGGRFYREQNHYRIIQAQDLPDAEPLGYRWITAAQLKSLTALTGYVNIEARSLLACLTSLVSPTLLSA